MAKQNKDDKINDKIKTITIRIPSISFSWKSVSVLLVVLLGVSVYFNLKGFPSITGRFTTPLELSGLVCIHPAGYDTTQINDWAKELDMSLTTYKADWIRGPVGLLFSGDSSYFVDFSTKKGFFKSICESTNNEKACEISEKEEKRAAESACEKLKKVDKPTLQAFVVSYCPFGIQMQRVLTPVVELLGDKLNIEVRYIGSVQDGKITAMHGEKEATENLRQICIREEQKEKYWDYISCFIKKGETETCLDSSDVDKDMLEECMNDSERGIEYAKKDFELQNKYGVSGSPTLILDGERVNEFEFGGRSAEAVKSMLCCAFKEKPEECSQKLNSDQAARGFSESYSSGSSSSSGSGGAC